MGFKIELNVLQRLINMQSQACQCSIGIAVAVSLLEVTALQVLPRPSRAQLVLQRKVPIRRLIRRRLLIRRPILHRALKLTIALWKNYIPSKTRSLSGYFF